MTTNISSYEDAQTFVNSPYIQALAKASNTIYCSRCGLEKRVQNHYPLCEDCQTDDMMRLGVEGV